MQILPTLVEGSIDCILTDPPFNVGTPQRITDVRKGKNCFVGQDFGTFDEGAIHPEEWLPQCKRLLTKGGVILSFYGAKRIHHLLTAAEKCGLEIVQDFHWCKINAPPPMRSIGFSWGTESGWVFRRLGEKHRPNKEAGFSQNWLSTPIKNISKPSDDHPTRKRVDVMRWLVRYWTHQGQTILDPFMGSGTTGVACRQLGRKFAGIESDPKYFRLAKRRIESIPWASRCGFGY